MALITTQPDLPHSRLAWIKYHVENSDADKALELGWDSDMSFIDGPAAALPEKPQQEKLGSEREEEDAVNGVDSSDNPLTRELKGTGVVRVHVHGGRGLKPVDDIDGDGTYDTSDPYIRLFLSGVRHRSETRFQTLEPDWDQVLEFDGRNSITERETIGDLLCNVLEVECYDENKLVFNNPSLGIASVDLKPLLCMRELRLSVPLSTQGVISLTVSWEMQEEWVEPSPTGRTRGSKTWTEAALPAAEAAPVVNLPSPGDATGAPPAKAAPAPPQPDMLSLSIAISILVKFILFDLVGFFQVNSALVGSMPDLEFPPAFTQMSRSLSSAFNLDFLTDIGESNCSLGSNHCYRIMVMMFTLLSFQLAFPAGYAFAKMLGRSGVVSNERLETLVDRSIHGNAIVIMTLHPPISKKLVSIIDCAQYNDVQVLSGFKDIECGSGVCTAVALIFICLYTLGVPLYVYLSLRAYLSPAAKERYKGNPILARYRARIGFICGKYEADFWYYELLEMTRKTGLMAVTSFIQQGA